MPRLNSVRKPVISHGKFQLLRWIGGRYSGRSRSIRPPKASLRAFYPAIGVFGVLAGQQSPDLILQDTIHCNAQPEEAEWATFT